MSLQPSASRTELLLACPRPFDPELDVEPDPPGEPARYGSAFHQVIAVCLRTTGKRVLEKTDRYAREVEKAVKAYDVVRAGMELAGHVKGSIKVFRNWLEREKLEIESLESARAVAVSLSGAYGSRSIPPHDSDHRYACEPYEVPGTADLTAVDANRKRLVVVDHKTGYEDHDFARPSKIPQMRTLGLAFAGTELGIFHADRQGLPNIYAEPYEVEDQHAHAAELHRALSLIGSGFMRTGEQCKRCPARDTCQAHTADLLSDGTASIVAAATQLAAEPIDPKGILAPPNNGSTIETRAAVLYDLLRKFRALDKAGTEEIRRLVRAGAAIETRDGKVLTLQKQTYETLSLKSVRDALGKVDGEKMIDKLREKGAVREATREMLIGEK